MRIGIDARSLPEKWAGGITEYTRNLLDNIFRIDPENDYVLFFNSWQRQDGMLGQFKRFPRVSVVHKNIPSKLLNLSFSCLNAPKIDRLLGGVDVMFFPHFIFSAFSKDVKTVLTVHDLSFHLMGEFFSAKGRMWHKVIKPKKMAQGVDRIIADSHNTAADLERCYGVPAEKISVIHLGIDSMALSRIKSDTINSLKQKYSLPKKYILLLGGWDPRKNSRSLIEAYHQLEEEIGDVPHLVLGGANKNLGQHGEKVRFLPYLPAEEKRALIAGAQVLVYPSYYEGFGFPPLEAMAASVPVIASNNSSLPEVVGGAGILINPYNTAELAFALKQVLSDNRLREDLINRGRQKSQEFSWEDTARKTLDLFLELSR